MTTPRPWPNDASAARDRAAELACESLSALKPMLESRAIPADQQMRCLAVAAINLQQISRLLESCGARTDPLSQLIPSISHSSFK
jgi:hypothetical protein